MVSLPLSFYLASPPTIPPPGSSGLVEMDLWGAGISGQGLQLWTPPKPKLSLCAPLRALNKNPHTLTPVIYLRPPREQHATTPKPQNNPTPPPPNTPSKARPAGSEPPHHPPRAPAALRRPLPAALRRGRGEVGGGARRGSLGCFWGCFRVFFFFFPIDYQSVSPSCRAPGWDLSSVFSRLSFPRR